MIVSVNQEYVDHFLDIEEVFPSAFALKLFLGNNPVFSFRHFDLNGKRILDLGFGDGRDLSLFHHLNMDVYGVEVDVDVVKHTEQKFARRGMPLSLRTGTNTDTGFRHDTFDIVYASSTIQYLADETVRIDDVIKHCHDILKPGGFFVGTVARHDSHLKAGATRLDDNRFILEDSYYQVRKGQHYHFYNSSDELDDDLTKSGFEVICVTHYDVDWFGTRETFLLFVAQKPAQPSVANDSSARW